MWDKLYYYIFSPSNIRCMEHRNGVQCLPEVLRKVLYFYSLNTRHSNSTKCRSRTGTDIRVEFGRLVRKYCVIRSVQTLVFVDIICWVCAVRLCAHVTVASQCCHIASSLEAHSCNFLQHHHSLRSWRHYRATATGQDVGPAHHFIFFLFLCHYHLLQRARRNAYVNAPRIRNELLAYRHFERVWWESKGCWRHQGTTGAYQ